jgi:hypothetical protein
MYVGCNGARHIHLPKNGFLRRDSHRCFGKKCKKAKEMYARVENLRAITILFLI